MFTNDYFEELVDKYSLPSHELEQLNLNQKLEEVRNFLKNEIYKQYKLQEGAEKMRIATTDKKGLNNLNLVIKESNMKIAALNEELQDLNSFIVITQSETSVFDSYNSEFRFISGHVDGSKQLSFACFQMTSRRKDTRSRTVAAVDVRARRAPTETTTTTRPTSTVT